MIPLLNRLSIYPYGIRILQTWAQLAAHFDALERYDIKLFIELGTHAGGLTSVMLPRTKHVPGFRYIGVEKSAGAVEPWIAREAEMVYGDCFSNEVKAILYHAIMATPGAAMVFCDNGDKPNELLHYAPLLRTGDFLSFHDYLTEVQNSDLEFLRDGFEEIEPEQRRLEIGIPLYRKL